MYSYSSCLNLGTEDDIVSSVLRSYQTNDTTYEFTTSTFRKTSRLPFNDPYPDGTPFVWFRSW